MRSIRYPLLLIAVTAAFATYGQAPKKRATDVERMTPRTADSASCKEEWRRYRQSEACFAKYRHEGGQTWRDKDGRLHKSVPAEAFRNCSEVKEPQC